MTRTHRALQIGRAGRTSLPLANALLLFLVLAGRFPAHAAERWTLASGVRVTVLPAPDCPREWLFARLPSGLLCEGPGETLDSSLLGRVLLRSVPEAGDATVDAETLSRGLLLEASAPARQWGQPLQLAAAWFQLHAIDADILEQERAALLADLASPDPTGALVTLGSAAWNQVVRHGKAEVPMRGDLARVTPESLLAFADTRLRLGEGVELTVCGPAALEEVRNAIQFEFGDLTSLPPETSRCTVDPATLHAAQDRQATWDLGAGYYMEWYELPVDTLQDKAMAHVLVLELSQRLINAGMEQGAPRWLSPLESPEGRWLALSAVVKDGAEAATVSAQFREALDHLLERQPGTLGVEVLLAQSALENRAPLDLTALRANHPPPLRHDAIEGDAVRRMLSLEHEMGVFREELPPVFRGVTREQLEKFVSTVFARERRSTLVLLPTSHE